jgi:zinc/manganese transport system substrate-binding protein
MIGPVDWRARLLRLAPGALCLLTPICLLCPLHASAAAGAIRIVAAENFYGDIAAQLAGPHARVSSVLKNPNSDPHLFEPDVATARAVADADLVVYNGLGYDVWMVRLLASGGAPKRRVVEAASVPGRISRGDNPHLWYDLQTVQALARAIVASLAQIDPADRTWYAQRLDRFLASLRPIGAEIERLRARYAGVPVAATEPVAEYLTAAIGLSMREQRFQLAEMNSTEPSARDTAAFEQALENRSLRVLIYNPQVTGTAVERLLDIARASGVPIVGMTETEPAAVDYQQWMRGQLQALARALSRAPGRVGSHP